MRRNDADSKPMLSWECKNCKRRDGNKLVNFGFRTHCFGCGVEKGKAKCRDIPPAGGPSVSLRHPTPAPAATDKDKKNQRPY